MAPFARLDVRMFLGRIEGESNTMLTWRVCSTERSGAVKLWALAWPGVRVAGQARIVVLPAPFGPSKPKTSPCFTETVSESRQYVRQSGASKTKLPIPAD